MSDYRSDREPLADRLEVVKQELSEVREAAKRYDELRERKALLEAEAERIESEIGARQRRRALPVLDNVQVASPCDASWDEMVGDERQRFCGHCQKNVYNLSSMTKGEAESLLARAEGSLCVRLYRRSDGTVLTADCPVGVRRRRRKLVAITALALGGMATGAAAAFFVLEPLPPVLTDAMVEPAPCPVMGSAAPAVTAAPDPPSSSAWVTGTVAVPVPPRPSAAEVGRRKR